MVYNHSPYFVRWGMKRSAGVTATAVIAFLGSAVLLLIAVLSLLGMASLPDREGQAHLIKLSVWFVVALEFGGSVLGIATGAGLLQLRNWARISILIFAGLLLFMGIPGLLMIPFMPMQQPADVPGNFLLSLRIFMGAFFGLLGALGVWWVVYFNKKSVRGEFLGTVAEGQLPTGGPVRPISITIIGWYMIVGAFFTLPFLFLHMPIFILGYLMKGWTASLFMLGCGIFQLVAGTGLLKLKPWSRILAIAYFSFFTFSSVMMVVLPGSQTRFEEAMKAFHETFGVPAPPSAVHIPLWFGIAFCLPLFAVVISFLITQKKSFLPEKQITAPLG
jgi:hypothetical protein